MKNPPGRTSTHAQAQHSYTTSPAMDNTEKEKEEDCKLKRANCGECGTVSISVKGARIIEGADASPGEYPYQVLVFTEIDDVVAMCGGAIIKRRWVLTAAHCFFKKNKSSPSIKTSKVTVMGGSIYRNQTIELPVDRVITHKHYKSSEEGDDIALIRLSEDIDFTSDPRLQNICLGEESDILYKGHAVATGWGKVKGETSYPNVLQEVSLDVITTDKCSTMIQLPNITTKVICAATPHKDTCQGDSGGPLVAELSDGRWAQIGITSYGFGCALPNKPGVYVSVSHYLPWIKATTGACTC